MFLWIWEVFWWVIELSWCLLAANIVVYYQLDIPAGFTYFCEVYPYMLIITSYFNGIWVLQYLKLISFKCCFGQKWQWWTFAFVMDQRDVLMLSFANELICFGTKLVNYSSTCLELAIIWHHFKRWYLWIWFKLKLYLQNVKQSKLHQAILFLSTSQQ